MAIVRRLAALGWPKGAEEGVPAAVQVCLTNYTAWLAAHNKFMDKLRRNDLDNDYGKDYERTLRLSEYLMRVMPSKAHFVQIWMEAINERVRGWDEWDGELTPFVFHPESKQFRAMGRGWAKDYTQDPDRWDQFCDIMAKEAI
jgi:hypothetical protein